MSPKMPLHRFPYGFSIRPNEYAKSGSTVVGVCQSGDECIHVDYVSYNAPASPVDLALDHYLPLSIPLKFIDWGLQGGI